MRFLTFPNFLGVVVCFVIFNSQIVCDKLNQHIFKYKRQLSLLSSYFRTRNLTALNLLKNLREELQYHVEEPLVSSYEKTANKQCLEGIDELFRGLLNKELWAFTMLDASSKIPPGIIYGALTDLGDFDECLKISVNDGPNQFLGQHCMVSLRVNLDAIVSDYIISSVSRTKGYTFSLCIPSTCMADFLFKGFKTVEKDANHYLAKYNTNVTVEFFMEEHACHYKQTRDWHTFEVFGMVMTLVLVGHAVLITIIDELLKRGFIHEVSVSQKMRYYIGAISLTANGKKLMWSKYEGDTMPVLYGLKFFTIIWIFLGHRMKLCVQQPMVGLSLLKVGTYLKNWGSMIFFNGTLAANVFFLISGTLNTYTYLNSSSQKSKRFLSHVWRYIKRYLRLTPAYAMVILGAATWMYRVGDGPLWDQIVGSAQNDCVNYWWTDLLYINNYYNPLNICIMQSWYLAAEMQMFWVSTIVLYTLWRWPKLGVVKLIFLTAVSIVVPFYVVYKNKIKTPMPFSLNQTVLDMQTTELYVPTHTKMVSYVTGLLCGYIIYLLRKRRITLKLSLGQNLLVWLVAFTLTSWAVFGGHHLFVLYSPYNRLDSSFNIALSPFCWSVGISWMIIACTMGYGGPINHILSWKGWIPLGRLSYGIYLTHVLCILYTLGTLRTTQYFTFYNVVLSFGGELIMSTFFALVLNLTIESPVIALMKGSSDTIERRQRRNSPPEISVQNISNAVGNRRSRC